MAFGTVCTTNTALTGLGSCERNNSFGSEAGLALALDSQFFATKASFATQADWLAAIKAEQIFPITNIVEVEHTDQEPSYYESPKGDQVLLRQGNYRAKYKLNIPFCLHQRLQAFRNSKIRLYKIDENGNIYGTSPEGTTVRGFQVQLINPEKMIFAKPDSPAFSVITINEKDSKEWNENGVYVNPTWDALALEGINPVTLSTSAVSALSITVKVVAICGLTAAGAVNEMPITGLVAADFLFYKASDGTAQTPTGVVDNLNGTYTAAFAALVTGTVTLKAPAALSDATILIKSSGAASYTV